MSGTEMSVEQARAKLGDLVIEAMHGQPTTLTRYGKPVARIVPFREPTMNTTTRVLVSAVAGDVVGGVELADPDCPITWEDLPQDAREWAESRGYGTDDNELIYVLDTDAAVPAGFPVYIVPFQEPSVNTPKERS